MGRSARTMLLAFLGLSVATTLLWGFVVVQAIFERAVDLSLLATAVALTTCLAIWPLAIGARLRRGHVDVRPVCRDCGAARTGEGFGFCLRCGSVKMAAWSAPN